MTKLSMTLAAALLAAAPFCVRLRQRPDVGRRRYRRHDVRAAHDAAAAGRRSYNAGLNHKKRAQEYEEKAAAAKDDKERDKQLAKAKSQYEDSIDDYKKAIGYDMTAYQAMNEMGYAYRKTGDYEMAVKAYNTALTVRPNFTPAIEYRAEAFSRDVAVRPGEGFVSRARSHGPGSGGGR